MDGRRMSQGAKMASVLILPGMFVFLTLAGLIACDYKQRTNTLKAQVDNDLENERIVVTNITQRDWVDVTFTLNKLYTYTHNLVPASKAISIPYNKFVDENGKAYDPLEGPVFRLWIATKEEYWGMH